MKENCRTTMLACFIGYIVQAVVNNFTPLLFVNFQTVYGIPLAKITLLITINFLIQLCVDLVSAWLLDRIGYRAGVVFAHVASAAGLIMLTILPELTGDPYIGILISVAFYAIGGGLLEVLISPMIEACPTDNKESAMSLLHSFYCWGHVGVVLVSTAFFAVFGIQNWKILSVIWALIPILNGVFFMKVKVYELKETGDEGLSVRDLCKKKIFWVFMLMMICSGASEQAVSQWASTFAEKGLGVSKAVGDLAGPMSFALTMGMSRLIFGKYGDKLDLDRFMKFSSALCVASYLMISLSKSPVLGLIGCAVTGFAVGIMWPGTYSKSALAIRGGGTAMFALLALGGDLGCSSGPTLAGFVSSIAGGNLRAGILSAVIFPALLLVGLFLCGREVEKSGKD
ncbi:MAG: MFS transporter [Candidatus Flemingibacterium sp.]|nr:MFS transporter [Candidatus Flemingibacterium sp.]